MSDVVHWLNKLAALVDEGHEPRHVVAHMRAAAAEIERLRAALREIAEENIGNTAALSVYIARAALEGK